VLRTPVIQSIDVLQGLMVRAIRFLSAVAINVDYSSLGAYVLIMAVQLKPGQEERLQHLASQSGLTPDELAVKVLDGYLKYIENLAAQVREGEDSAEHDGWLIHEEVFERLNKRLLKPA
jgi:predicted transcriptional regulator